MIDNGRFFISVLRSWLVNRFGSVDIVVAMVHEIDEEFDSIGVV
jgi:hypothetical protein